MHPRYELYSGEHIATIQSNEGEEVEMTRSEFETCRPQNSYVLIFQCYKGWRWKEVLRWARDEHL